MCFRVEGYYIPIVLAKAKKKLIQVIEPSIGIPH